MSVVALLLFVLSNSNAFSPRSSTLRRSTPRYVTDSRDRCTATTAMMMMPPLEELSNMCGGGVEGILTNTNILLSELTAEKQGELAKGVVITLLFGGGLIPAAIDANKSLIGTLLGKRRGGEDSISSAYIDSSSASGPPLPNSFLLFASETIPLVDIIAVLGRIDDVNSIADWKNLDTVKLVGSDSMNPPMWLPRGLFKENVRKAKWRGWPVDGKTGEPLGGRELEQEEGKRVKKAGAVIGDAALDAVFDSWAWGASVATPDKVEATLAVYKKSDGSIDLNDFIGAAVRGRAVTGFAALTFVFIQVIAYSCLFIAPLLRVVFDIDIGFGVLGECDGTCTSLF